jgi:hypothetical protein
LGFGSSGNPVPGRGGAPTASRSSPTRAQAAFVIPNVYLGTLRSAGCLLERPVFEPTTSLWRNVQDGPKKLPPKAPAQRLNLIQALAPAHHSKSRIPSATRSTAEEMALVTLQMKPRNRPDPICKRSKTISIVSKTRSRVSCPRQARKRSNQLAMPPQILLARLVMSPAISPTGGPGSFLPPRTKQRPSLLSSRPWLVETRSAR